MTISDRVAVKQRIVTTLQAAYDADEDFAGVKVWFGDPGENRVHEQVTLGLVAGAATPDAWGPTGSNDLYSIECVIETQGQTSEELACVRAQAMLNVLNAALFSSPPIAQDLNSRVYPGKQDGPNGVDASPQGLAAAVVDLTINCSAAVRGS